LLKFTITNKEIEINISKIPIPKITISKITIPKINLQLSKKKVSRTN
jgi:hypothetical protein